MRDRTFFLLSFLAVAVSCLFHIHLYGQAFYAISWDGSGRILDAYNWTLDKNLLRATEWLPFYRIVVGLGLELYFDLFLTPRVISFLWGISSLLSLGWFSHALFKNRQITILTLFLGAFVSQRVALSLAPLSSIMFTCIIIISMTFFTKWIYSQNIISLVFCSIFLAISGTIRYEGWIFSASFFGIVIFDKLYKRNKVKTIHISVLLIIVSLFPLFWTMLHAFDTGNLLELFLSRGTRFSSTGIVLSKNPLIEFILNNAASFNLIGMFSAMLLFRTNLSFRRILILSFGSLLIVSIGLFLAKSVQTGPSWRMIGVWSILLIPFTANFIFTQYQTPDQPRFKMIYILTAFVLIMFTLHLYKIKQESRWAFPESERLAGHYLNNMLRNNKDINILIESSGFFYLNIIVASQHPGAFLLNSIPEQPKKRSPILKVKGPIDESYLAERKIKILVFKKPEYKEFLNRNNNVFKIKDFGNWTIYRLL